MDETLEAIRDHLAPKESVSLVVSSATTDWTTYFSRPLHLDPKKRYELSLVNLETYNSIPNVTKNTDTFVYSPDMGSTWKTITLPVGSYDIAQINGEIQCQLKVNGDWDAATQSHFITVGANTATLRSFIEISNKAYQVDLNQSNIRTLLGFEPQVLSTGHHTGENTVNIMPVNSILVHCDLVNGSFLNGRSEPVLYSFYPNVSPGFKIIENPNNLVYLPVGQAGYVQQMRVWLTDQDGSELNLRGEIVSIRLHLRGI